jgi:hypothetical protein
VQLVSDAAALAIKMPGAPPMTEVFVSCNVVFNVAAAAADDAVATISGTPKPTPPSTTE